MQRLVQVAMADIILILQIIVFLAVPIFQIVFHVQTALFAQNVIKDITSIHRINALYVQSQIVLNAIETVLVLLAVKAIILLQIKELV